MHKHVLYIYSLLVLINSLVIGQILAPEIASGIYFLDVGQGDAQLIAHKDIKILIDTGRDVRVNNELERVMGDKKYIDIVMLTHPDADHIRGVYSLLERYNVGVLLIGGSQNEIGWEDIVSYARQKNIPVHELVMRDSIQYGDVHLEVLWPDRLYVTKQDNEKSLVVKYKNIEYTALFTGDITEKIETILKNIGVDLDSDILKVAHHGSKYSSSIDFLYNVSPILSIIGVGKNAYGHPTQETLDKLYASGSAVLRTDEQGTIRVYKKDGIIAAQRIE